MEALIESFHLDVKLIVAQLVNFTLVMGVLWYFAIKPVMKIMNERTKTIEESLKKAEEIEMTFKKTEEERVRILSDARVEARGVLEAAATQADEERVRIKEETKADVAKLVSDAKKQIASEKEKATVALKRETAELVIKASKGVLGEHAPKDLETSLAEEALKKL